MPSWVPIMVDAFLERSLQVPSAAAAARVTHLSGDSFLLPVLTGPVLIITLVISLVPLL